MNVNLRLRLKFSSVNVMPFEPGVLSGIIASHFLRPAMNKSEFTQSIAACLPDIPKRDVDKAVRLLLDQLSSTLVSGGRCEIRGFGTFSLHTRKARMARNPKTGGPVTLPEKRMPHFKPGRLLRERVNLGKTEESIQE